MPSPFAPPIALALYTALFGILLVIAWRTAARGAQSATKTSIYGSGEAAQPGLASPGYKPFFMVALFFAILHLGVLVVGSGGFTLMTGVYLLGLIFSLIALALG
jgi:NADH:ubiquinone oxidoreductase subunit 3 (subunit A)